MIGHQQHSESEPRIKAMIRLAQNEPGISIRIVELDADPLKLTCSNGTLDLRTCELREHRREDLITKLCSVDYDPNASCPGWMRFLEEVTVGNADLSRYLQRAVGYSLTGETVEQVFFLLYGDGENGKSTFLEVIRYLIQDYSQAAEFSTFSASRSEGGARNDLAKLNGARFVTAIDSESGKRISESLLKAVTGGDTITARFLFSEHFDFTPQFKLWLATNYKPSITGTDRGIWRRVRLIPFFADIPNHKRDRRLAQKLKTEAAGILRWAVEGLRDYHAAGLGEAGVVREATSRYREEQEAVAQFISECCIRVASGMTRAGELHQAYQHWALAEGGEQMNARAFSNALTKHGLLFVRRREGKFWKGIETIPDVSRRVEGDAGREVRSEVM